NANGQLEPADRSKGVEIGRVVAGNECAPKPVLCEQGAYGRALVGGDGRDDLEHLSPVPGDEACGSCPPGDGVELTPRRRLVGGIAVVQRSRQSLVLELWPGHAREQLMQARRPFRRIWVKLEPMVSHVGQFR